MISGIVNEKLLPIIPVRVKKLDGAWQKLSVLLDTGSAVSFMLAETTISQHGIAFRHDYNSPASVGPIQRPGNSMPMPPYWVELELEGTSRVVEAHILETDDFQGVIGPDLLPNRRITIDVEKSRAVEIDCIPAPTPLACIRGLIRKPERQRPCLEYVWKLPWVDVAIKDSEGGWRPFSANVDTGNSEQLSLPPSKVEEFGLRLPDKCRVNAPDGPFDASCGEVEICWQGSPCTVTCIQHQEKKPPLVGMKLLCGNRITIDVDVDYLPPVVEVARIPGSASSKDRLRCRSSGRPWWRG